jgi:hypothetical protein
MDDTFEWLAVSLNVTRLRDFYPQELAHREASIATI